MKKIRVLLLLILVFAFVFTLTACKGGDDTACTEHIDENGDGKCDKCNTETEDNSNDDREIKLIENGTASFQVVISYTKYISIRSEFTALQSKLSAKGIDLAVANDVADGERELEILVGEIENRDEKYRYDYHKLGPDGTAVKLIDGKIIIAGGSSTSLMKAVEKFIEDHFDGDGLDNVTFDSSYCHETLHDPDSYKWSSLAIAGNDIKDYVICADTSARFEDNEETVRVAAESLQSTVYNNCGVWLPILDTSDADTVIPEHAIVFEIDAAARDQGGFTASISGKKLVFSTSFPAKLKSSLDSFVNTKLRLEKGDVDLSAAKVNGYKLDLIYITYEEFGAKGDGRNNDFYAIYDAHTYANKYGHKVRAKDSATYYISETRDRVIEVYTDVEWGSAKFIIDDTKIDPASKHLTRAIFYIGSDHGKISSINGYNPELAAEILAAIKENGIKRDTANIGYAPGRPMVIVPYNSNHKVYIRYGANASSGADQHELILVDKDGNIDPTTPLLLDYTEITDVEARYADDTPITVSGGHFTTIANQAPSVYQYWARGISVVRSNTTVRGFVHDIIGEKDETGAPYGGFINVYDMANNILVENCTFRAHKRYHQETAWDAAGNATAFGTQMGTYDISITLANNIYFKNCKQSNFYDANGKPSDTWYDSETGEAGLDNRGYNARCWGVMASNYAKNITYDGCELNRMDAHAGAYNVTLLNSKTLYIELTGGGTARIEGSTVYNSSLVNLREDYGSTWAGKVYVKNSIIETSSDYTYVVTGKWYNHDFGYDCTVPEVYVDTLTVRGGSGMTYIYGSFGLENSASDPTQDTMGSVDIIRKLVIPPADGIKVVKDSSNVSFKIAPGGSFFASKLKITEVTR